MDTCSRVCVTKKKTNDVMRGNNIYKKYGFNSLCFVPVVIQCSIGKHVVSI